MNTPKIPKSVYAARLAEVIGKLPADSIAVIVSNPEQVRSNDTEFEYRQSSDMLYLTGFPEPESALVCTNIGGKAKVIFFVRPKDRDREIWTGIRIGIDGAKQHFFANQAYTFDKFNSVIGKLLSKAKQIYYKFGRNAYFDEQFRSVWQGKQKPLFNPEPIVHEMRLIKSDDELEVMRHAALISTRAHIAAAQSLRPGMREFQLEAIIEGLFLEHGAAGPAYQSIVASGNNAVVLHYTSNKDVIGEEDLVLIDAACEYEGYASDITRTLPANGRFNDAQRELYQLVLDAQLAAIRMARPGKSLNQVHGAASKVLRTGLIRLGILPPEMSSARNSKRLYNQALQRGDGSEKSLLTLRSFFMHGTSHWMGLDVHDVYAEGDTHTSYGKDRELEPGMVFTVEPGIYIDKNDVRIAEKYRGIGIRIEDDVVVTAAGCEVLTSAMPKSVPEIEQMMYRC